MVLISHLAHLVLMGDFIYFYIKAIRESGFFDRRGNIKDLDFKILGGDIV
jgi:hypothetical protein